MFEFVVSSEFLQSLKRIDFHFQTDIKNKLQFLAQQENPLLFAKKLKSYKDVYRFKAGDFRIIFRLSGKQIILLLVKHRKDIYEGL